MSNKDIGGRPPVKMSNTILDQVAKLASKGASERAISEETKISPYHVKKALKSPEVLEEAKRQFTAALLPLIPLAIECLRINLEEKKNLEGVKVIMSHFGALKPEETGNKDAQSITVVLPGASIERPAIEVTSGDSKLPSYEEESDEKDQ